MEVCKELKLLSEEFNKHGHKLYIVGGYVRNALLGLPSDDIDITSSLPVDELSKICKQLKIKTCNSNPKLGTILLKTKDKQFEYTRFRLESYNIKGTHTPDEIEFVDDIRVDCKRRDFTINSLYYDIEEGIILDMTCGQADLQNKILRTTQSPDITLSDDGLRILRGIRFACTLGFDIHKKTLSAMKTFTPFLNRISKERILKELNQLVVADIKHKLSNHSFVTYLKKLHLPEYIFNSSLKRMKKITKRETNNFYSLNENSRLIGFYILILKKYHLGYINSNQLGYNINMLLGINGIKESLNNIHTTEKIYRIYQNLQYNIDSLNASINYLTLSDSEREIIDNYLDKKAKQQLSDKMSYIKDNNLPLHTHQLDITAQDLINNGIEKQYISKMLSTLYNQVLNISVPNEKKELIKLAKEINETFNKLKELS